MEGLRPCSFRPRRTQNSLIPIAKFNRYVYLQATRIAAHAEGIAEACSSVWACISFENVYVGQRVYSLLLAKLQQGKGKS